jgi:hypothetical protein
MLCVSQLLYIHIYPHISTYIYIMTSIVVLSLSYIYKIIYIYILITYIYTLYTHTYIYMHIYIDIHRYTHIFRLQVVQINRSVFPPYLPLRHGFARPPWAPSVTSRSASATPWRRRRAVDSCRTCDARLGGTRQGNSWNSVNMADLYEHGSIPINTIFSGMNIHLPAILM